jgi:hypothetical protein
MALGNKLAANGKDRSAAFVRAWAIVKAEGLTLTVKGVTFGNRQEALQRLTFYSPEQVKAFIVPEPENPADPSALAVMVMVNGGARAYHLGYVPKEQTAAVKALGPKPATLRVVSGTWGWSGKTTFGARIALAV